MAAVSSAVTSTDNLPTFPLTIGTSEMTAKEKSRSFGIKWGDLFLGFQISLLDLESDYRPSEARRSRLMGPHIN